MVWIGDCDKDKRFGFRARITINVIGQESFFSLEQDLVETIGVIINRKVTSKKGIEQLCVKTRSKRVYRKWFMN